MTDPIAWAVYGGKTGILRYVERDEDRVRELVEGGGYEARPLFESTPSAEDVREALAHVLAKHYYMERWSGGEASCTCRQWVESVQRKPYTTWAQHVADALLSAVEVRPHGTVTDTAVDALRRSLYASGLDWSDAGEEGLTDDEFYQAAKKALKDVAAAKEARW